MSRIFSFVAVLILVWIVGSLLIAGRGLLIPFVMAVFIWHLLNTIHMGVQGIPYLGERMPSWISRIISLIVVVFLLVILVNILSNNVNEVIAEAPRYQENLLAILNKLDQKIHIKQFFDFNQIFSTLNIQSIIVNIYGVFTTITSSAVLITLYVVFLFVEQHYVPQKIAVLLSRDSHQKLFQNITTHIIKDTQTYLGIKTVLSLATAISSWLIMNWVGLDFAEFWALLIFFLNYIPNIGAIVATAFPAALALVQFENWWPFLQLDDQVFKFDRTNLFCNKELC